MNNIERLQKLSGIKVTESTALPADRDSLLEAKARLKGIIAEGGRFTFKHTHAMSELAKVEAALAALVVEEVQEEVVEETVEPEIEATAEIVEETAVEEVENETVVETVEEPAVEEVAAEIVAVEETTAVEEVAVESVDSVEDIVAKIMETDLTPQEIKVDYQNGPVQNYGLLGSKFRLPASVKTAVKKRIAELNQAIATYDDKGFNDKSIKSQAVDNLTQILDNLSTNDLEGLKKAQIYFSTLMSPLTDFFPPQLINWLATADNPHVVKESILPDDQTAAREKWISSYSDGLKNFDGAIENHFKNYLKDDNLVLIAKIAFLEFFKEFINYTDDTPFVGVKLTPQELEAAEFGLEVAKEEDQEIETEKARRNSGYRSQEEIDDPMNDPDFR